MAYNSADMANQPPPNYAEYPRPSFGAPGFGRGPGVYFDAIGESFNLVKQDIGQWIAATIVYFVVYYALLIPVSLITAPMENAAGQDLGRLGPVLALQMVLNLIPVAIQFVMLTGMIAMGVRKSRGEYINVGMMFEPFKSFGTVVGSGVLYYVIILASVLACIVPSLFFTPVLFLMPVVAFLKNVGPIQALSITFDACKSYWAGLLALSIVMGLIAGAGACLCLVGLFVTWPMYCVVMGIHYRAFFESATDVVSPVAG
jgi:hypothetical protein